MTIIEDMFGDSQDTVLILLSLLDAAQALNQDLWSRVLFFLIAGPLCSSLEAYLQHNDTLMIVKDIYLPFLLQYLGFIFQQDNRRPHTVHVAISCLTDCQTVFYTARSLDLSPIEHDCYVEER